MRRALYAVLMTALMSAPAVPALAADRAAANLQVFDKVWRRVDRDYYDTGFKGVDWAAARAEFRPQAAAAADELALYTVLDAMLGRLQDQHVYVTRPDGGIGGEVQAGVAEGWRFPRRPVQLIDGAWVVAFDEFDAGSAAWLADQLSRVPANAPLVVDLRGNRGGYIDELGRSLACLAPEGRVVARFTSRRGQAKVERVAACAGPERERLVVLVGPRTRSSAELFAAAVQESGRGVVVGETSGGAVLAARDVALPDGGVLTVSFADARTGNGVRLEGQGVRPDVKAAAATAGRAAGRDAAMDRAVAVARGAG